MKSVIPLFRVILISKYISDIILVIQVQFQSQRSIPRSDAKILFLSNTNRNKLVTHFVYVF